MNIGHDAWKTIKCEEDIRRYKKVAALSLKGDWRLLRYHG